MFKTTPTKRQTNYTTKTEQHQSIIANNGKCQKLQNLLFTCVIICIFEKVLKLVNKISIQHKQTVISTVSKKVIITGKIRGKETITAIEILAESI